jgi:hypothetical protein
MVEMKSKMVPTSGMRMPIYNPEAETDAAAEMTGGIHRMSRRYASWPRGCNCSLIIDLWYLSQNDAITQFDLIGT